ncbi:MAG: hypothetical protein HZC54_00655 [Verrucomicrobia bacterium]|nr:hypothetical protein [Verrucomicrobiota bacterium]
MRLERQMLLSLTPKLSEVNHSQLTTAHGKLVDAINGKADKPMGIAPLNMTVTTGSPAEMQLIADKVDAILAAIQA